MYICMYTYVYIWIYKYIWDFFQFIIFKKSQKEYLKYYNICISLESCLSDLIRKYIKYHQKKMFAVKPLRKCLLLTSNHLFNITADWIYTQIVTLPLQVCLSNFVSELVHIDTNYSVNAKHINMCENIIYNMMKYFSSCKYMYTYIELTIYIHDQYTHIKV